MTIDIVSILLRRFKLSNKEVFSFVFFCPVEITFSYLFIYLLTILSVKVFETQCRVLPFST